MSTNIDLLWRKSQWDKPNIVTKIKARTNSLIKVLHRKRATSNHRPLLLSPLGPSLLHYLFLLFSRWEWIVEITLNIVQIDEEIYPIMKPQIPNNLPLWSLENKTQPTYIISLALECIEVNFSLNQLNWSFEKTYRKVTHGKYQRAPSKFRIRKLARRVYTLKLL